MRRRGSERRRIQHTKRAVAQAAKQGAPGPYSWARYGEYTIGHRTLVWGKLTTDREIAEMVRRIASGRRMRW